MFKVKEEEMPHLVEERRFIRRLKERDDPLPVRDVLRRSLDDLVHLLVEFVDDGDRLVVEDDVTTAISAAVVRDALDTDLVQCERGGFITAETLRQHLIYLTP